MNFCEYHSSNDCPFKRNAYNTTKKLDDKLKDDRLIKTLIKSGIAKFLKSKNESSEQMNRNTHHLNDKEIEEKAYKKSNFKNCLKG